MYEECRGRLQMEFYASTADMWSSRATEPYISLYGPLHKEGLEFEQLLHPDKFFPDTDGWKHREWLKAVSSRMEFRRGETGVPNNA